MSSTFIVMNEWLRSGEETSSSEVVAPFSTYEKAHFELSELAKVHDIYLMADEDNFVLQGVRGLVYDEYRIDEWEQDQNG